MRWGSRKQHAAQCAAPEQGGEGERKGKGKGKAFFSFSPLSWLAKLTAAKPKAAAKHAPAVSAAADEDGGVGGGDGVAPAFPSCIPNRTGPTTPVVIAPGRPRSGSPRRSPAPPVAAVEVAPRRLSVGNDNADAIAARRHCSRRRRHCSLGSDRELPPLSRLIPFSLAGSPAQAPAAAAPSDTDAGARSQRRRPHRGGRRQPRRSLSGGGGGGRRSFSGRMPPPRVRVRAPELLESLAVVRRTRDPQRAFRESMVEMIASSSGGGRRGIGIAARPDELERLLACYLALNADEHHDCIVKVFRQVWFEHVNQHHPRTPVN